MVATRTNGGDLAKMDLTKDDELVLEGLSEDLVASGLVEKHHWIWPFSSAC